MDFHEEALEWLQRNAPELGVVDFEPGDVIVNVYKLRTVLKKIHEIRNSIVGLATFNWSEHMYPLVAALGEIGLNAEGYEISRPRFTTMLERTLEAEKEVERLRGAYNTLAFSHSEEVGELEHQKDEALAEVERFKGLMHGVERAATFLLDYVTTTAEEDLDDEKFWKPMREARSSLLAPGPDVNEEEPA